MKTTLLVLALAMTAGLASAQPVAAPPPARLQIQAVRLAAPVTIDGLLDEAVWRDSPPFTELVQSEPVEGARPTERTEVRIAYDDDALYVGARMWDEHPDSILARLTRRDVSVDADRLNFYLDPFHDRRSGYYFMLNAAGVQFDGTLMNDSWDDLNWDGVWSGAAHVDDQGWTCEMRIPFSQFRFNRNDHQVWGVNFKRVIARRNESDYVVYMPRDGGGFVSRFPDLVGLDGIRPGRAVELLPYVTTKGQYLRHDAGDPFRSDPEYEPDGGVDVRTSLGSRLTLNATVNPDFGQVEVDPAVVNLSDVESYFDEKRPFFVEGAQNFRFGNEGANDYWGFNWPEPTFFYSRRIGRAPQVVGDADFVDTPVGTRILGAAKLTGKLTPTTNFGMLHALTGRETAHYQDGLTRWDAEAEPLTYYGATHALKEFKDRRLGLGFMTTAVERDFSHNGLGDDLNRSSLMSGVDGWAFLDRAKKYVVSGYTAVSRVDGSQARIRDLQESSRHYLQRPDRRHFRLDPNATSLTGMVSRYWINKQNGSVLLNCAAGYLDPHFDVNDMGFMSRSGLINTHFGTGYQWTKTNHVRKYTNVMATLFSSWNTDGDRTVTGLWGSTRTTWINNWETQINLDHIFEGLDDRRTRGGPMMKMPAGEEYYGRFQTNFKNAMGYEVETNANSDAAGSYYWNVYPYVEWKPASNIMLSMGPGYERTHERAQYVDGGVDDPAVTSTYGHRYLFGTLDQRTLLANIRLNCAFSPRLTLQLFAQPLVSSGRYGDFKELAAPRTFDFVHYGASAVRSDGTVDVTPLVGAPFSFDDPDFDFKSLRGNAVLRWEYLPGSTLFLVWTQERTDDQLLSDFRIRRSFDRLLDSKASNIFLVKATRYFTM